MDDPAAVVVFARYPHPGAVKTRLAAVIGAEAAALLARAFLEDLRERLGRDPRWSLHWAYDPPDSPFGADLAGGLPAFSQVPGDLGRRMASAMDRLFEAGFRAVVVLGSDVPHVSPERVAEALSRLAAGAELVLGPAEDGGYYLLAARSVPPVFDGIGWGGASVLSETLARAGQAGLRTELLASDYDLDREEDLRRLSSDRRLSTLAATRKALRKIMRALSKQ